MAISVFLTYMLYPLVWKIERKGVNRAVSILIVLLLTFLLFGGAVLFVSVKVSNATINIEVIKEEVETRSDSLMHSMEDITGINSTTISTYMEKAISNLGTSWQEKVGNIFSKTTTTLFQIGILPVLIFFFLFYRTKTAYFIFKLVGRKSKPTAVKVLKEIADVATKYLTGQLLVILVLSVLNTAGLYIVGVPNGIVFGILAAFLNLIPYLGMLMGNIITILYVLITVPDSASMAFHVFLVFAVIQFLENNLITPNIVGNNIKINPFAIIVGVLFANLVWGIAGMLIVIPFLAILKIIMRNVDDLKPFAYLISDRGMEKQKMKITWWNKLKKLWKRK